MTLHYYAITFSRYRQRSHSVYLVESFRYVRRFPNVLCFFDAQIKRLANITAFTYGVGGGGGDMSYTLVVRGVSTSIGTSLIAD